MKAQLVFILSLLITSSAWSGSKVSECRSRPEFLSRGKIISSLPRMALIGKSANFYVESKNLKTRIWGTQNFVRGESKIVCGSTPANESHSFSIYAPTLIDHSSENRVGPSYWQFHMIANAKQFGIWNQKSRLFSKAKDLEEGLSRIGAHMLILQISVDQYELIFTREREQWTEIISIRYDAVPALP